MALVVDTGPLYGAYDRDDRDHERCRALLNATHEELIVPAPVVVEFDWLCSEQRALQAPLILLDDILAGAYTVMPLTATDYARVREILAQYADGDVGIVDAAVLAIVERLNEPKLATLDGRHFRMLRPRHVPYLELVPG